LLLRASGTDSEQWLYDVADIDAAPQLAAAAAASAAAAVAEAPRHASTSGSSRQAAALQQGPRPPHQQHQQQHWLHRPAAPRSGPALREMLQQQISWSTSWQQLATLLGSRQAQLTLKHLYCMVTQVSSNGWWVGGWQQNSHLHSSSSSSCVSAATH
jgi:hypothetical protein